jgi:hypothetical protein
MGSGLTIAPVSAVVASDHVRPVEDGAHAATATAAPPPHVVTPVADANATPHEAPPTAPVSTGGLTQRFIIDPRSRQVIYRLVDARTEQVIQQVPDQALLANRAYSNAIQNGASHLEAQIQADIQT